LSGFRGETIVDVVHLLIRRDRPITAKEFRDLLVMAGLSGIPLLHWDQAQ
jgi:hypothetical protein